MAMRASVLAALAALASGSALRAEERGINVCYFTNWARYRGGLINTGKDVFEMDLDADLCTHFMYGFATVTADFDIKSNDPNADHPTGHEAQDGLCPEACNDPGFKTDWSDPNGERCDWPCSPTRVMRGYEGATVGMKRKNADIKVLISVGGWNFNDCAASPTATVGQGSATCELFSQIAASEQAARLFARNVIAFCRKWGFDGFDLDWEYPVVAGHNSNERVGGQFVDQTRDYENYITMLKLMKEEFAAEGSGSPLLLTAAVGVGLHTAETAYDIPGMSQHLDLINLMTYDLHGGWEPRTGCNANLWATAEDVALGGGVGAGKAVEGYPLSVSWAVDYWIEHGASPSQLTMGLATYGRGWKLADPSNAGYNAPASGASTPGASTKEAGYKAFYEIQELLQSGHATRHYDDERQCPYIITDDGEWIGYDDKQSLAAKVDFARSRGLAGTMVWALDLDDFTGAYEEDGGKYPLIHLMREHWHSSAGVVPTPAPTTAAPTTAAPTTEAPTTAAPTTAAPTTAAPTTAAPTTAAPTTAAPTTAAPTTVPPTTAAPTTAPPTTAAPTTAAPTPSSTTAPAGGVCVQNTDCSASAWCQDQTYAGWCQHHSAEACPAPQCVVSGGSAPTTSTTGAPTTAAPTVAPTSAPTTEPPTEAPTPTESPSSCAGAVGGPCSGCLASNGVCYSQPQSWCDQWADNTWCGGSAALVQLPGSKGRRLRGFLAAHQVAR